MKFNWKILLVLSAMVFLFACEKGANDENDSNNNDDVNEVENDTNNNEDMNETENDTNEDSASTDAIAPEDFPEAIMKDSLQSVYNQTSNMFQSQITLDELEEIAQDFNEGVDHYELISELQVEGLMEYQWLSDKGTVGLRAYFGDDNAIEGLQFIPVTSENDSDEVWTENTYQMPFKGEWMTFWGGVNELVNYHYATDMQRYAYDFLVMEDGVSYDGDASENESYYAYGEAVLAPLEGEVVAVENTIEENTPNVETNEDDILGNHVIIKHENDEYSVMAHMKTGSVTVEKGDTVETGEQIGEVGNSGNSSEPHIHFQVSDGPDIEEATSIRIQLENGEDPIKGETVTGFSEED